MTNGDGAINGQLCGNDHGTLPATQTSPVHLAQPKDIDDAPRSRSAAAGPASPPASDDVHLVRPVEVMGDTGGGVATDAEAAGIDDEYRRRLAGLRRIFGHQRALALRAARDARFVALRALRQKRERIRADRSLAQRLQPPTLG